MGLVRGESSALAFFPPESFFSAQSAALFAFDGLTLAFMKASACPNYGLLRSRAGATRFRHFADKTN